MLMGELEADSGEGARQERQIRVLRHRAQLDPSAPYSERSAKATIRDVMARRSTSTGNARFSLSARASNSPVTALRAASERLLLARLLTRPMNVLSSTSDQRFSTSETLELLESYWSTGPALFAVSQDEVHR